MKLKRGIYLGVLCLAVVLLISSIASAGLLDWFKKVTGQATTQPTNVSITVSGINPVTITIYNQSLPTSSVSNDGIGSMLLYVTITDPDGAADINTTSVIANFSKTGEVLRSNSSCIKVGNDLSATAQNYSCTINMYYYDAMGAWTINVGAKDFGNLTYYYNTTTIFSLSQLQGIEIFPTTLTWTAVTPGDINKTSNNDPTLINNTGNYLSNLTINALNLHGITNTAQYISVGNISVSNNTNANNMECSLTTATTLVNGTDTQIMNSNLTKGDHNAQNNQTGQEQLFYCFRTVPTSGISSQTYSTSTTGSWSISLT